MRFLFCLTISIFLFSQPTYAAWHKAEGEHFVIYANQNASSVKKFAERLEAYHAAMTFMLKREPESPSPSNRVTVFVVSSKSSVRKLADLKSRYVAGVYRPLAGNIVSIVPKLSSNHSKYTLSGETVLRHEYAHHFLFNISKQTFPLWFQEGFAEFYASGRNENDGTVILGGAANHRAYELHFSKNVPIERLLNTSEYLKKKTKRYDEFYGRSWMLFHYLTFAKDRRKQLSQYQKMLFNGIDEMDAAKKSFGDLRALNADLNRYAQKKRISVFAIPPDRLTTKPVSVQRLDDAEAAIMPIIMESRTGVDEEEAKEIVVEARDIATKYPGSAAVQEALAEAEYDAGYDNLAIAAADKALAIDPTRVRAQIQKIYAFRRKAENAEDANAAWKDVRSQIVAANRMETNHPIPLIEFYNTFRAAGREPSTVAIQGLERALQLAPFDQSLRLTMTAQYLEDRKFDLAAQTIRPLAYNPHRSGATQAAEKLLNIAEKQLANLAKEPQKPETPASIASE
ncbi:MAG: hypothetical protein Pars2KO_07420 [Parasphingorhabdus sp.]